MSIGSLALRATVGPLFVGHGTQKLFGWFGGHGPDATGGFFESLGMRPGKRAAVAAGINEALGGLLLTLGAATPLAATMISSTMVTAIRKVHASKGPWIAEGGFEYNLVLIGALATLVDHGPGAPSVDDKLLPGWKGPAWTAAMVGAAVAGSYLVDQLSEPAPEDSASAGDPDVTAAAAEEARFARERAAERASS
jgi:putative oxidoreductase